MLVKVPLFFRGERPSNFAARIRRVERILSTVLSFRSFRVKLDVNWLSDDRSTPRQSPVIRFLKDTYNARTKSKGSEFQWRIPNKNPYLWAADSPPEVWSQNIVRYLGIGYFGAESEFNHPSALMNPIWDLALASNFLKNWRHVGKSEISLSPLEALIITHWLLFKSDEMKNEEETDPDVMDRANPYLFDPRKVPAAFEPDMARRRLGLEFNSKNFVGAKHPPSEKRCRALLRKLKMPLSTRK